MSLDLFKLSAWNRALPISLKAQKQCTELNQPHTGNIPEKEQTLERSLHPSIILEITELPPIEETPGLHLEIEADLSLHQNYQLPWASKLRCMPLEHTKFLWDIVSYISKLQGFFDFALGGNIPNHIVQKAIEDNDPSDGNVSLDNCVIQALTFWWTNSNLPAIWKSDKIKQGFIRMGMPGIYDCIIKRHPTLDPSIIVPHDQQPGPSGHCSQNPECRI